MPDISAGQPERFELLYTIYGRRVRSYIAAYLGRPDYHLTEDLSQETWLEVWKSLAKLRAADDKAFGWLATIARRVVIHHFRLARNREKPTDFHGGAGARWLLAAPAAEDQAVANLTAREMLADSPAPLGVAA
jgi:RNA polymerase sigma factor (sigma-70 family)